MPRKEGASTRLGFLTVNSSSPHFVFSQLCDTKHIPSPVWALEFPLETQDGAEGPQGATVTLLKTLHSDDRFGIESQGVRKGLQAGLWRHLAGPWGADGIEAT